MSLHDAKTEYDPDLTSVPPLEDDFSLEEILAEFGSSRQQKILQDAEQMLEKAAEKPAAPPPAEVVSSAPEPAEESVLPPEEPPVQPESLPDVQPEGVPESPRPISLEEVVGSTVEAVMEEQAAAREHIRRLVSRLAANRGLPQNHTEI